MKRTNAVNFMARFPFVTKIVSLGWGCSNQRKGTTNKETNSKLFQLMKHPFSLARESNFSSLADPIIGRKKNSCGRKMSIKCFSLVKSALTLKFLVNFIFFLLPKNWSGYFAKVASLLHE
jgi:hypothetical protein